MGLPSIIGLLLHSGGTFTVLLEFVISSLYDEAKVNVNNDFLGMLGIISRVETAALKDKD